MIPTIEKTWVNQLVGPRAIIVSYKTTLYKGVPPGKK